MLTDKRLIHALGVTLRITLTVVVATTRWG
jgi:hypothetical protein